MILQLPYPISTNRYWKTYRNIVVLSKEGATYKQIVRLSNLRLKPDNSLYALNIVIHPRLTKKGTPYAKLIDIDNGLKCILDSLIGIVYFDDKQVKSLAVSYGEPIQEGSTTVTIAKIN